MSALDYQQLAEAFLNVHPKRRVEAEPLSLVMRAGQVHRHPADHVLCREGDEGTSLYFLVEGAVRVERPDLAGGTRVLTTMAAPCMVGHMALVDGSKRSATCIAEGAITLVELDRPAYLRLLNEETEAGSALRRTLLASLTFQLVAGNRRLESVFSDARPKPSPETSAETSAETGALPARAHPRKRDLNEATDILAGWDLSAPELEEMQVVYDESQRRNWAGNKPK